MTATLLFAATVLGASGLKDPTAKADPIVGVWTLETIAFGGKIRPDPDGLKWEFTADGKHIKHRADKKHQAQYTVDSKADPRAIDLKLRTDVPDDPVIQGIFKVQDDKLTIALPQDRRTVRPTDFETPKDNQIAVYVFKRLKKD
jgi:uncharacterized protein (TIGR03067 family)